MLLDLCPLLNPVTETTSYIVVCESSPDTCHPTAQPCGRKFFGDLIVLLPFLGGHVFLVRSNLIVPAFLLPSAQLSETFLPT